MTAPPFSLHYLLFDPSAGTDGTGLFEAMAAVVPADAAAVEAEIAQVLDWAGTQFPDRGPVEDGGDWEAELQVADDVGGAGQPLRVFSLSLAGSAAFCTAFEQQFGDAIA
ncbi:hypothetical protein [Pseudorhodoferax sp.]|uniref:hypothetical protein n=1 Tax=Pseudorhodoferax sp. TaxID=1993553 RepID=UPI0039E40417